MEIATTGSTQARTGFARWRDELGLSKRQAAALLGKTTRAIEDYEAGRYAPTYSVRALMAAIADGYTPRPWPIADVQEP
jgi:DNA-binding transcriptional regulator YiaG